MLHISHRERLPVCWQRSGNRGAASIGQGQCRAYGMTSLYAYHLRFRPFQVTPDADEESCPDIVHALSEQLGLKLKKSGVRLLHGWSIMSSAPPLVRLSTRVFDNAVNNAQQSPRSLKITNLGRVCCSLLPSLLH